jgi:ATP-dependent DNA ligase
MLQSRRGADLTARFPEVLAGARELGSVVLDGERVAYGPSGRLEFASLNYGARRRAAEGVRLIYVAFDLLAYRGRDLRDRAYRDRRARLETILGPRGGGTVQLVTATDDAERGVGWISAEQAAVGVEGCVAKPLTSR